MNLSEIKISGNNLNIYLSHCEIYSKFTNDSMMSIASILDNDSISNIIVHGINLCNKDDLEFACSFSRTITAVYGNKSLTIIVNFNTDELVSIKDSLLEELTNYAIIKPL